MPNFIYDGGTLPSAKNDLNPLGPGQLAEQYWAANDYNTIKSSLEEARDAIIRSRYINWENNAAAASAPNNARIRAQGGRLQASENAREYLSLFPEFLNILDQGAVPGTDISTPLQSAVNKAVSLGVREVFIPAGSWFIDVSINLTTHNNITIRGMGAATILVGRCPGKAMFDLTGANGIAFKQMTLEGFSGSKPACAFLMARNNSNAASGRHRFNDVTVRGNFTKAAVGMISSEENELRGCNITTVEPNGVGLACTDQNPLSFTSDYATFPGTWSGGAGALRVFGGTIQTRSTPDVVARGVVLANTTQVVLSGVLLGGAGLAGIHIDGDVRELAVEACEFESIGGNGLTNNVYVAGTGRLYDSSFQNFEAVGSVFFGANNSEVHNTEIDGRGAGINLYVVNNSEIEPQGQTFQARQQCRGNTFIGGTDVASSNFTFPADSTGNQWRERTTNVTTHHIGDQESTERLRTANLITTGTISAGSSIAAATSIVAGTSISAVDFNATGYVEIVNSNAALPSTGRIRARSNGGYFQLSENGGPWSMGRPVDYINVKDPRFAGGAKGDGVADDTAAIQAAIDYALTWNPFADYGRVILIPFGTYKITNTLQVPGSQGFHLKGEGRYATWLQWAGPAGIPMLRINSSSLSCIEGLFFWGNAAAPPSYAIYYDYDPVVVASYGHVIRDVMVDGQATYNVIQNGIGWSGSYGNNSEIVYDHVIIRKFSHAGVVMDGTQQKCHNFYGCQLVGNWDGVTGSGNGGQYAIRCNNGNYNYYGGGVSSVSVSAFNQPPPNDPITIDGVQSETCYRFFDGGDAPNSARHSITIRGCRIDNIFDTNPGGVVSYSGVGPFIFEGNSIHNDDPERGRVRLNGGDGKLNVRIWNNFFSSFGSVAYSPVIYGGVFWQGSEWLKDNIFATLGGGLAYRDEILDTTPSSFVGLGIRIPEWHRHGPSQYIIAPNSFTANAASQSRIMCVFPKGTIIRPSFRYYNYNAWAAPGSPNVFVSIGTTPGGQEIMLETQVNTSQRWSQPSDLGPLIAGGQAAMPDPMADVNIYVTVRVSSGTLGNGTVSNFTDGFGFVDWDLEVSPRYVPGA